MMNDLIKKYGPIAAIAGVGVGAVTGLVTFDFPSWTIDMLKQWGPAGMLLLGVVWYVPRGTVPAFIKSQQDQAVALSSLADGVGTIADKGSRMEDKIDELLINQRLMVSRIDTLKELIIDGRKIS